MKTMLKAIWIAVFGLALVGCGDPCDDMNCENGGTCEDGYCSCPTGYTGKYCETKTTECSGVSCQNGGVCVDGTCNCPEGYTGSFCQTLQTPRYLRIRSVMLVDYPATPTDTTTWDPPIGVYPLGTYPDIMMVIDSGFTEPVWFRSDVLPECVNQNYTFGTNMGFPVDIPIDTTGGWSNWSIWLVDVDASSIYVDFMMLEFLNQIFSFPNTPQSDDQPIDYHSYDGKYWLRFDIDWVY